MIETFEYIEIWEQEKLAKIPSDIGLSMLEIIRWYNKKHNIKTNPQNQCATMRNIQNRPNTRVRIKSIINLTEIFEDWYVSHNKRPYMGRIKIINPDVMIKELRSRDIIAKEFQNEYPHHKISMCIQIWTGKTLPKLDMIKDITEFIIDCDKEALDLPKNKGKRWDLDEWINTANIKKKQSWEQEYD
tara:strand:- start:88 stop:648 length:561 start_codon:yes stop_codon:yes gene_type:complete